MNKATTDLHHLVQRVEVRNPVLCRFEMLHTSQKIYLGSQKVRLENIVTRIASGALLLDEVEGQANAIEGGPTARDINGKFRHGASEQQQLFFGRQLHRIKHVRKKSSTSTWVRMRRVGVLEQHCPSDSNSHVDLRADLKADDHRRCHVGRSLLRSLGTPLPHRNGNSNEYCQHGPDGLDPRRGIEAAQHDRARREEPLDRRRPREDRQAVHQQQACQHSEAQQRAHRHQPFFHLSLHPRSEL